jgi:D-mannonate dehydratase
MYLRVDWGNGTPSPWQGPYDSNTKVKLSHTWNQVGTHVIKTQVKGIYGAESYWETFEVSIPRNRVSDNSLFFRFLERFPLLQKILIFKL